jgi:hypothetical protein
MFILIITPCFASSSSSYGVKHHLEASKVNSWSKKMKLMTACESYHQNYNAIVSVEWMGDGDVLVDKKLAVLVLLSLDPTPERPSQDVGVAIPLHAIDFILSRF